MRRAVTAAFVAALAVMTLGGTGCGASQRAAQRDPMRCERDPQCQKRLNGVVDCSRQCNDDPACMDRCEQVQAPNRGLGH